MKIKSAVWQGAHTVRKKLCQLVLFVQENAWQTGVQGKKASVAWMREFIWQGLHFTCGGTLYLRNKRFRGSVLFRVRTALLFLPES